MLYMPPHVRLIISTLPREKGNDLLSDLQKYSSKSSICFLEVATLDFSRQDVAAAAIDELVRCRPCKGNILPVKETLSAAFCLMLALHQISSLHTYW